MKTRRSFLSMLVAAPFALLGLKRAAGGNPPGESIGLRHGLFRDAIISPGHFEDCPAWTKSGECDCGRMRPCQGGSWCLSGRPGGETKHDLFLA